MKMKQKMKTNRMLLLFSLLLLTVEESVSIRSTDRIEEVNDIYFKQKNDQNIKNTKVAIFALGSFWRSEAIFGCVPGVVRTSVGYAGGTKVNPEFRNLGDHAECVQIEYDPKVIQFKQLLDVFWSSHDSSQIFGQGPDVGNQYRSIIFTDGAEEAQLAVKSKEREQTSTRSSIVSTQIQKLGAFYLAESDHQKFELKRNPLLLQLIGNIPDDELVRSSLATKLNSYAAELCPWKIQKEIEAKVNNILKKGWPVLREI